MFKKNGGCNLALSEPAVTIQTQSPLRYGNWKLEGINKVLDKGSVYLTPAQTVKIVKVSSQGAI
jgi:hypothetical protein